jgi:cytochrome c oxidase accessory protein FixG
VRGEPRGKFNKKETRAIGDCIDCAQCVKVCPTGIDIRNGTQLECINCTACIDACNKMMDAVGLPAGLIRYASENNIVKKQPSRFTWRMKAYAAVMILLLGVLVFLLATRTDVGVSVLRTPGQLYQQTGGRLSNLYNYRLLNKTYQDKELELRPEDFSGEIEIVGDERLLIPKESNASGSMFVYIEHKKIKKRKTELKIGVYENGKKITTISTVFLGPFK